MNRTSHLTNVAQMASVCLNQIQNEEHMRFSHHLLLSLIILALFSSCAATNTRGTIKENHAVTSIFRSAEINQNYNYFYYGVFLEPDTIMGIDKAYSVKTRFWTPVELTKEHLQTWIVALDRALNDDTFARRYMGRYQGAYVLDPQGKVVGMWYSKKDWGVFDFQEGKIIVPSTPSLKDGQGSFFLRHEHD